MIDLPRRLRQCSDNSESWNRDPPDHPRFSHATWAAVAVGAGSLIAGVVTAPKAPKAAELKTVDAQAEQQKALAGNLAAQGSIESLVSRSNSFTQDQASSLAEKAMPGYTALSAKFMKQASGMLDNPYAVPQDVQDNLSRMASERGISAGTRGEFQDFSLLRDFGVESLKYGESRINSAQSIMSTVAQLAPRINPMSPMAFYVTPAQQIDATVQNNTGQYNSQQSANNASAAAANANASMWGGVVSTVAGAAGGYMANRPATTTPSITAPANANIGSNPALTGDWHSTGT